MLADILIIAAGIIWTIETIPQIIQLHKTKQTAGISLPFFIMCLVAYTSFIIGNVLLGNWSVVIAHSLPFVNVSIIIFLVIRYRKQRARKFSSRTTMEKKYGQMPEMP